MGGAQEGGARVAQGEEGERGGYNLINNPLCVCEHVHVCDCMVQCMYMTFTHMGFIHTHHYVHVRVGCERVVCSMVGTGSVTWLYHTYMYTSHCIEPNRKELRSESGSGDGTTKEERTFSTIHDTVCTIVTQSTFSDCYLRCSF